jgi:hypothetical protein
MGGFLLSSYNTPGSYFQFCIPGDRSFGPATRYTDYELVSDLVSTVD